MNPDLLSAVLAAPDDDAPRLIIADWLDENGDDARAEFIRLQIDIANHPPLPGRTPNTAGMTRLAREQVLLHKHGEKWRAPFCQKGAPLQNRTSHGQFVRGFIETVWMTTTIFLKRGPALFDCLPLRELRITRAAEGELQSLFHFEATARLKTLDLSGRQIGDRGAALLFDADLLASIQKLRLCNCGIGDLGAEVIANCRFNWPLVELDVTGNRLSNAAFQQLKHRFGSAVRFRE